MAELKIGAQDFSKAVENTLKEYGLSVTLRMNEAVEKVGNKAADLLKDTSPNPKRKGGGKYAKSWACTKTSDSPLETTVIVHNKKHYPLNTTCLKRTRNAKRRQDKGTTAHKARRRTGNKGTIYKPQGRRLTVLDIQTWLETTEIPVKKLRFLKSPSFPYIVWLESSETRGADSRNLIISRDIAVELYFETEDGAEANIETLLNALPVEFSKETVWLTDEKMFETIYNFELEEKL